MRGEKRRKRVNDLNLQIKVLMCIKLKVSSERNLM